MPIIKQSDLDDLRRLRDFEAAYLSWRDHVLRLLASEKFTGSDQSGERKDWIAVADIQNLLRCLEDQRG
jgi:hypothetical protein